MPSINLIYQHSADNVAALGTVTASPADTDYPAANLVDLNPAKPAKLSATSGRFIWDFGSARRVDIVALIHHNLTAGLDVRIQGNATNAWTSPTFNQAITIPAYRNDGYPRNPWLDLTGLSGYSVSGFRYWSVGIIGTNGANVAIGDVWLGSSIRRLDPNISWPARRTLDRKLIEHKTDHGVCNVYDLGVTVRTFSADLDTTDDQGEALLAWWEGTKGRTFPFLIIPDGTLNSAWLVRWAQSMNDMSFTHIDRNQSRLEFEEVSRGLVL